MRSSSSVFVMVRALMIAGIALGAAGCSANYQGERLFWKAQQLSRPLEADASKATPEQFAKAVEAFEHVISQTPGTTWAARAQIAIGSLYALEGQYEKARHAYTLVLQNYNQFKAYCLAARLAMARTYEMQQEWDEAVTVYKEISEYFPWTVMGLEAPLHIARTFEQRKQVEDAQSAYERAVRMYTRLLPDAPTPEHAVQIKGYLTLAYQRLGQWENAIGVLEELASAQQGSNRPLVLVTLGTIYQTKLRNAEKAVVSYQLLVNEFPEHPFGKVARAQLIQLGALSPESETSSETSAGSQPLDTTPDISAAQKLLQSSR